MTLAPLATLADLEDRGIDTSNAASASAMLAEASEEVRDAAGCPISLTTSTVKILGAESQWLTLPGGPVTAVSEVKMDGSEVTDWRLLGGSLWRRAGWWGCDPVEVEVTMTHGYAVVPEDIVGLVCALAGFGINAALDGDYETKSGLQSETDTIDDYTHSVTYATGGGETAGVGEMSNRTRQMLRERFGGGVYTTGER